MINKKQIKGISLIVLIITIVVIIILAAAIMLTISKNNPIQKAKESTFKSNIAEAKSELDLVILKQYANSQGKFDMTKFNADETKIEGVCYNTNGEIEALAEKNINELLSVINQAKLSDRVMVKAGILVWKNANDESDEKKWFDEIIGKSQTIPQKPGENVDDKGYANENITISVTDGKLTIPKGYSIAQLGGYGEVTGNLDSTKWKDVVIDSGVVITDTYKNEFVWIPTDTYGYDNFYGVQEGPETIGSGITEQNQIDTYGGFWISRYEASSNSGKVATERNKAPWCDVLYANAKEYSQNFTSDYGFDTSSWEVSLPTGKMWDTMCKFIASDNTNIADSSSWGNYIATSVLANDGTTVLKVANTPTLLNSGITQFTSKKNIYDIAGNAWEWINDKYSSGTRRVYRGGCCYVKGSDYSAKTWSYGELTSKSPNIGFRIAIFLK